MDPAAPTAPGWRRASGCPRTPSSDPVPAILEYLPYRKGDGTARARRAPPSLPRRPRLRLRARRHARQRRLRRAAARTSTCRRSRTTRVEVIAWLAAQPWCSGAVGMIGISWGGFNGLQVAARRPPALKAIITLCSTDDRYADDVHYMGGCVLGRHAAVGRRRCSPTTRRPPDPAIVGERWRDDVAGAAARTTPLVRRALAARTSAATPTGSTARSARTTRAIDVPGLRGRRLGRRLHQRDPAAARAACRGPRKGLIGPWAHDYPHVGAPGPAIGFLQECAALVGPLAEGQRDRDHGRAACCASGCRSRCPPRACYAERPGRWVAEPALAAAPTSSRSVLAPDAGGGLAEEPRPRSARVDSRGAAVAGLDAGRLVRRTAAPPTCRRDQRARTAARSCFDVGPLDRAARDPRRRPT